jgi:hypothetical protein
MPKNRYARIVASLIIAGYMLAFFLLSFPAMEALARLEADLRGIEFSSGQVVTRSSYLQFEQFQGEQP